MWMKNILGLSGCVSEATLAGVHVHASMGMELKGTNKLCRFVASVWGIFPLFIWNETGSG